MLVGLLLAGNVFAHVRLDKDEDEKSLQRRLTYYYLAAERQKELGNNSAAAELLQHCLEIAPNDPAATYDMAMVHFNLRNDSEGLKMLQNAVVYDANNPWYLQTLASVYLSMHKMEEAVPILEQMSKLQTKRTDILAQLFELYKSDGRTQDAINVLDRIQTLQGNNVRIAAQKFALYSDLGDTVRAFSEMKALCREFPYDASNLLILGDMYLAAEMPDSAIVYYSQVERIDPHNISLQAARLQYQLCIGDTARYREMRDSLVLEDKADIQLRVNALTIIAREALEDSTRIDRTKDIFDRLLSAEKPPVPFLQLYMAFRSYAYQESEEQLTPIMERILEVEPSHYETIVQLLQHYVRNNDIPHVGDICRKALIYHPSELAFHYFLAMSLAEEKKIKEAQNALHTAIRQADEESSPTMLGDIYSMLGDIEHELGNEKEAFAAYDSCLTYNPDNVMCLNNYAYFLSLKNEQLDKAEKMSYRSIKAEPNNKTYLDTYAWILFMQGDYATARIYMDRVIDPKQEDSKLLEDEDASAVEFEHAGDIYAKCEQMDIALRFWKLAQQKDTETKNPTLNKKIRKQKYIKK